MTRATCIKAEKHPNADALNVYLFELQLDGLSFVPVEVQIVANLTNVYIVGDLVNLILPGETYEGITIVERKVRGVLSQGMAVGKV